MRLFQSADVLEMTDLSRSQLREWCGRGRRNLIPPDVTPRGPGRHALFTWQTVLILRLLKTLHSEFAVEVAAWAPTMIELRRQLEEISFPSLWRSTLHIRSHGHTEIVGTAFDVRATSGILLPLDPHLLVIATKLSLPPPEQLPLFPALQVLR